MIYCRACGHQIHETATACPNCGYVAAPAAIQPSSMQSPANQSLWMAITALVISILSLLIILSAASDLDTLTKLSELESVFGSHTLKGKVAEEASATALGGLVFVIPSLIFGIISLAQKRSGRGMAIASIIINGFNLLMLLGIFGTTLN